MSKKVLIIDDEAEIRRNLTFGLMQEGYECIACPNGLSAIHELNDSREKGTGFDFLITDIFMPDIDGLKILKVIKREFPEIEDLVNALNELSAGATTLTPVEEKETTSEAVRESNSAYMTIHITDPARSMEIYNQLRDIEGVASCDAVRGDMDIIILAQAASEERINALFDRIRAVDGIQLLSMSQVARPKLDRDVETFIDVYKKTVKKPEQIEESTEQATTSYIIVDIDEDEIQEIFMRVFFIDEVIFCDVIDNGKKLVGMVTSSGAMGKTPRIIEKLNQVDGVLRVREAQIIKMVDA